MRIGQGFDVHAFGTGDHVVIGGVHIPFARGLVAHSDGDVLLHALSDALLGALALGDIGHFFPDSSQEWAGADSRILLRQVMGRISEQGYEVGNVDITIIAQAPKMAPHIEQMKINIADDLGIAMDRVGVKATTTERLGFTGRGEGIACQAICLLNKVAP